MLIILYIILIRNTHSYIVILGEGGKEEREKRESVCEGAVVFYCDACLGSKPEMVDEHRISRCIRSSDLIEFEREILLGIVDLIEIGCEGQDSYRSF